MRRRQRTGRRRASTRLLAVLVVLLLAAGALPAPRPATAAGCVGDEQLLVAPTRPRVGRLLAVSAFSSAPHDGARLVGPDGPLDAERVPLGDRFVWQALVVPDHDGEYRFAFGATDGSGAATPCVDALVVVGPAGGPEGESLAEGTGPAGAEAAPDEATGGSALFHALHPWTKDATPTAGRSGPFAVGGPRTSRSDGDGAAATATGGGSSGAAAGERRHRASSSARRSRSDNRNGNSNRNANRNTNRNDNRDDENGNESGNDNRARNDNEVGPTPTRTPTPTKTPTLQPTPSPTLAPPTITGISPGSAVCNQTLTIKGQWFGASAALVDGQVRIDGVRASITSWSMTEVEVRVPSSSRPGNDRVLEVVVAGQTATYHLRVSC